MTKQEFVERMEKEKPLKGSELRVKVDKLIDSPYIIGCFVEDEIWKIYQTKERGGHFIIKEFNNESDAYDYLYDSVYDEKRILDHVKQLGF